MYLNWLIFTNLHLFFISAANIYDCSNNFVYLNVNEIAFFQSTDFPRLLNYGEMGLCTLTFISNTQKSSTKNLTFFIEYFELLENFEMFPKYSISSADKPLQILPFIINAKAAQGYVIIVDTIDNCPLESISKEKPFRLSDEKQIIYLQTDYYGFENIRSCIWKFSAPSGYGFKIVIQQIKPETIIKIKNSTDLLVNERSLKLNHPYYNRDQLLIINLNQNNTSIFNNFYDKKFRAYLSIVKQNYEITEENCFNYTSEDGELIWTNMDEYLKGYKNNVKCNYTLIIPKETFASIDIVLKMEKGADVIKYAVNAFDDIVISNTDSDSHIKTLNFGPYKNETKIFWEFSSDGSFQATGFQLSSSFIKCQCEFLVLPCDSFASYITFCGEVQCNITIEPCITETTLFTVFTFNKQPNDFFRVFSDNEIVLEINSANNDTKTFVVYLNSTKNNIFQSNTFFAPGSNNFEISARKYEILPIDANITLSENVTNLIVNLAESRFTVIELSNSFKNQQLSFLLYCFACNDQIILYNNENLNKVVSYAQCFTKDLWKKCEIKSRQFAIYPNPASLVFNEFLAIRLSQNSKGCVFNENIFMINDNNTSIVALASQIHACTITILFGHGNGVFYYHISHAWTQTHDKNIKIFAGTDQTKLFMEFNSKSNWKNIVLNSRVYNILIPPSAAIFLVLQNTPSITIEEYPYQSIISSPNYGLIIDEMYADDMVFFNFDITKYPVKFTVLDLVSSGNEQYFFIDEENEVQYFVNKTGDSLIFNEQVVDLSQKIFKFKGRRGVLFYIESLNYTKNN